MCRACREARRRPKVAAAVRHHEPKRASAVLLFMGYLSAVLGGLLGIWIGHHLAGARIQGSARRVHRYDQRSRRHGKAMWVIGAIVFLVSMGLRQALL